jgi:hypothetical protein
MRNIVSPLDGFGSPFGPQRGFNPRRLFLSGEQGAWYDPSDLTTLFTDTAGTTPATVGSAVALMLDKSGRANHATQATTASRPIYGIHPVGGTRNVLRQTATLPTQTCSVTAAQHTLSFRGTGTVTLTGASIAGPLIGTGAGNIVSLTFTPSAGNLTLTVLGTVNDAQLELGSARSGYQLVSDAGGYNVTEAGVASVSYLAFDGVDDTLNTTVDANTLLGVSGTDPGYMIVGGVRFNTATGSASAFARSAFCGDTAGYFGMWAHTINGGEAGIFHWDTGSKTSARPYTVGSSVVVTGRRDPAVGASGTIYGSVNAVSATGTGAAALNGLASTFTIGRQFNTYMNGRLYSLIVRGLVTDAANVTSTQTWVAGKMGVTL